MKPILSIISLFFGLSLFSQTNCENINFEEGNTSFWESSGIVTMVNRSLEDPYGHFPLAVSGYNAIQLGNTNVPTSSTVTREITVNNNNQYFIYSYAIVFLGYPHDSSEASYVKLSVRDGQDSIIPCTELLEFAQLDVNEGFFESSEPPQQNLSSECCYEIYFKPWTTVAIDLTPYMNQTLTIELTSSWCQYAVDWGYAYFDAYCSSELIYEHANCNSSTSFISSVEGFESYVWSGPGIVSGQGTNQIEIDQTGTYTLDIPGSEFQCSDVHLEIEAAMNAVPSYPMASFTAQDFCSGQTTNFANTSQSDIPIETSSWFIGENPFQGDHVFETAGDYQITLIVENSSGCTDTVVNSITILPSPFIDLGPDLTICPSVPVTLKAESSVTPVFWITGEQAQGVTVIQPGYYWAEVIENGCVSSDTVLVEPSGAFISDIPNVFTPNNDLVNDLFEVKTSKAILYELLILNRWGNMVFQTSNPNLHWDGNTNNQLAEDGVYTYRLIYQFDCMEQPEVKHGIVSLFRN